MPAYHHGQMMGAIAPADNRRHTKYLRYLASTLILLDENQLPEHLYITGGSAGGRSGQAQREVELVGTLATQRACS